MKKVERLDMKKMVLLLTLLMLSLLVIINLLLPENGSYSLNSSYSFSNNLYDNNSLLENNSFDYLVIDRFEGDFAVCETDKGKMINIEIEKIPKEAKEGHVLRFIGNRIEIDYDETEKRENRAQKLMESLWEH